MRFVIFTALLIFPALSQAEKSVEVEAGKKIVLNQGTVTLAIDGKASAGKQIAQDVTAESKDDLTAIPVADGAVAIHAVTEDKAKSVFEAVFLMRPGRNTLDLIWNGRTSLKGDPGERAADAVRFQDLTQDNIPEITIGKISEAHRLCGQEELPLLFRQVYDLKSGKFRPILAKRPGLAPTADLEGTVAEPATVVPLIDQISAESASRSAGDKGDLLFLSKPSAASDKDRSTVWTPGTGNGAGEMATFHVASDVYGVTRVGISALPTGTDGKTKYDRPKSLILSTDKEVYRLIFKDDPATTPTGVVWFLLPKPSLTSCLSLVVESTYAPGPKSPFGLAEIQLMTEVDEPNGLNRLAADLNTPKLRRQAAMLLKKVGDRALLPIRGAWKKLDAFGRRLAAEVLSESCAAQAADLLAEAALDPDALTREAAIPGLRRAPDKAAAALEKYLSSKDDTVFTAAVEASAALGTESAVNAMASRLGRTDRKRREILISAIVKSVKDTPENAEDMWSSVKDAEANNEKERMVPLLLVAAEYSGLKDRVFEKASALYDAASSFAERYLLIEVLGKVSCGNSQDRLVTAATDKDTEIRAAAIRGISVCAEGPAANDVLVKGLSDPEPPVRLAALDAVSFGRSSNFKSSIDTVSFIAHADPWPVVRAHAVRLAVLFPRDKAVLFLRDASRDRSPDVRELALIAVMQYFGKDADAVIEERLMSDNETEKLKTQAAVAAGRRCQKSAVPALTAVLKKGAEPMADPDLQEAAVAAALALGDIGTKEAVSILKKVKERSNPATDRAIEAALKSPGSQCAEGNRKQKVGPVVPTSGETP
jgi:HEAT repeat protein